MAWRHRARQSLLFSTERSPFCLGELIATVSGGGSSLGCRSIVNMDGLNVFRRWNAWRRCLSKRRKCLTS